MDCLVCGQLFDPETHRPKLLHCGHTVCLSCLTHLGLDGTVTCPVDHSIENFTNANEFQNDFQILGRLKSDVTLCQEHGVPMTQFCDSHLQACCPNCQSHDLEQCRVREIRGNETISLLLAIEKHLHDIEVDNSYLVIAHHKGQCKLMLPELAEIWANLSKALCDEHTKIATSFCKTHFQACCSDCMAHDQGDCLKVLIEGNEVELKSTLIGELERRYQHAPGRISESTQETYNNRLEMNATDLIVALKQKFTPNFSSCDGCFLSNPTFLDIRNIAAYCINCCGQLIQTNDFDNEDLRYCPEGESALKVAVLAAVSEKMKRIDFYNMTNQLFDFFSSVSRLKFDDFLTQAKIFADLPYCRKRSPAQFPESFQCPGCKAEMSNDSYSVYKLPCKFAFHGICKDCMSQAGNFIYCPMDGNKFSVSYGKAELEYFESKRINDVRIDQPVLAIRRYQSPPSTQIPLPPSSLFPSYFVLNRFRSLRATFRKAQIETLLFLCTEPVRLAGVAISGLINQSQTATIKLTDLVQGSDSPVFTHISRNRIQDDEGPNIVNIMFLNQFLVQPFQKYALTVQISGNQDQTYRTFVGNLEDRPEDLIGTDRSSWDFETRSLENRQNFGGEENSSILRLFYKR